MPRRRGFRGGRTGTQQQRKERTLASRYRGIEARRRANPNRAVVLSYPGYNFLPQRAMTKIRYCDELSIASASTLNLRDWVIRANSIFDPDYSNYGGNGQPLAHDQLATLYNEYRVHACKIKATFSNESGVSTRLCVVPTNSATQFTAMLDACEQPYAKTTALAPYTGGPASGSVSQKKKTTLIMGIKDLDKDEVAAFGASPINEWYYHVIVSTDPYSGSNYINGVLYIEVVYYIEMGDRISLARS